MSVAQAHERYKSRRKQADADAPAAATEAAAPAEPAPLSPEWFEATIAALQQATQQKYDEWRETQGMLKAVVQMKAIAAAEAPPNEQAAAKD